MFRPGSRPMPAPARPMCWRSASSGCCWRRRSGEEFSASPSPRPRPPIWRTGCSSELRRWTALDDASSTSEIARSTRQTPTRTTRARARRLFASALETPGGLKVQTIHAFCTRLLHQFPFEANVGGALRPCSTRRATRSCSTRLTLEVLLEAPPKPDSALGRALATAIGDRPPTRPSRMSSAERSRKRDARRRLDRACRRRRQALAHLSRRARHPARRDAEQLEQEYLARRSIAVVGMARLLGAARRAARKPIRTRHRAARCRAQAPTAAIDRPAICKSFCTNGARAAQKPDHQEARERAPRCSPTLAGRTASASAPLIARRNARCCRDRTKRADHHRRRVIARYAPEKDRRGALDYDDLIDKTLACSRARRPPGCSTSSTSASTTC